MGKDSTTSIPAEATAAVEIRLVKGNDPNRMVDLVVDHIRARGYRIVDSDPDAQSRKTYPLIAKITRGLRVPAARTSMDTPAVKEVEQVVRGVTGDSLLIVPTMGATLPLHALRDPFVIVPTVNHDNNQHAPDENLRIANLWYAIDVFARLITME